MDCGNRDCCRILLKKKLKILQLISQYTLPLPIFVISNRDWFLVNSKIHYINITHISDLLLPLENLGIYQKGVYYSGIKILLVFLLTLKNFPIIWGHLEVL